MPGEFVLAQIGVLGAMAVAFAGSLVLCLLSFRAAAATRRALKSAQDLADEMRHLTAQMESATRRAHRAETEFRTAPAEADPWTDKYGERAQAEADAISGDYQDRARPVMSDQHLEAAKKAAIEPSALLRHRARRR
jgi:hypothetical protein